MAIDENKEYTSSDVLTLDDALSLAVLGYKVRAVDMQPGSFVDYQFSGFRINFDSGASSGWRSRDHDATVDWHVIDDVHVDAYKRAVAESFDEPTTPEPSKWGRSVPNKVEVRHVEPPVGDVLVMGDGGKWGSASPPKPAPAPADSVGKWGKALPPTTKDKWGR